MVKVVCVLYPDPEGGPPLGYARDGIPFIEDMDLHRSPAAVDFKPGELLGSVSGELGLRKFLEDRGHQLVVTSSKDGPDSVLESELHDAEIVISQPFWPAYMTAKRIAKAPKLKLCITAGIGSDHVDLEAACKSGITVTEACYANWWSSIAEHTVMMILGLVSNYLPSHDCVRRGGWDIADCVARSYDLEGMHVGSVHAGRVGLAVMQRLKPFGVHLHYTHPRRLSRELEQMLGLTYHPDAESMVRVCDVVAINGPLHPGTEHMFDRRLIGHMKRGAYLVNTARGKICDTDAITAALEAGQLAGYAGDAWFPQPAPEDHPWRTMPNHGMTPHMSGASLSAQARCAGAVRKILECYLGGKPLPTDFVIVQGGKLVADSYSPGDATKGSEEAAREAPEGWWYARHNRRGGA